MSYRVVVRTRAETDMTVAAKWYEEQSPGLGTEFLRAVEGCIATVARNPAMFPVMYRNVRRALFRRFPYGVLSPCRRLYHHHSLPSWEARP